MRYTVSILTQAIKTQLEQTFPALEVEGEISNCRFSSTGHLYFSLKDNTSRLQCVLFRSSLARAAFMPEDGQFVVVKGSISVYPPSGSYQLICSSLSFAGEGQILKMLEERKRQFAERGYFDSDRKRRLPAFPVQVAVISSPGGAAVRDIIQVITRRSANIRLTILPAPVQGLEAAPAIARQIQRASKLKLGDVIIVTRGGGSIEDLLPFSDEKVVKAIVNSKVPVISAVGHEIDWSLADHAADLRAPTPSAAAELVTGEVKQLESWLAQHAALLKNALRKKLAIRRMELTALSTKSLRELLRLRLRHNHFRLEKPKTSIINTIQKRLITTGSRVRQTKSTLQASSPKAILEKGYTIIRDRTSGTIIKTVGEITANQNINIQFNDGMAPARIDPQIIPETITEEDNS